MPIKKRVIRRKQVEVEEEPVEEEPIEEEPEDDEGYEIDEDDDEEFVDDDDVVEEDDEPEPEAETRRVPRRVVSAPVTKKVAPPPAPVKKAAPAPAVAKKAVAPAPVVTKKPIPVTASKESVGPVKVQKVEEVALGGLFTSLLDNLNDGQAIIITRQGENKWQVSTSDQIKGVSVRLSGAAYWDKVLSPDYVQWQKEWEPLSYDEKKKQAKKLGAKWETHADQRVDQIRIAQAVMDKLKIEKYLPEYRTRASRDALKG